MQEIEDRFKIGLEAINLASLLALNKESEKIIEEKIISKILSNFSQDSILSEGIKKFQRKSEFEWIIDPIDGTNNYINDLMIYGISIALFHNNKCVFGIVKLPKTDELFYRKQNSKIVCVPEKEGKKVPKNEFSLVLFRGILKPKLIHKIIDFHDKYPTISIKERFLGSVTYSLMEFLKNNCKVVLLSDAKLWDVAACFYILQGKDCLITDWNGKVLDEQNKNTKNFIIASDENLHEKYVEIFKEEF